MIRKREYKPYKVLLGKFSQVCVYNPRIISNDQTDHVDLQSCIFLNSDLSVTK